MAETEAVVSCVAAGSVSRDVLEHSTGRWGALTLIALLGGRVRFAQVRRAVDGISDRMLAQTLRRLEQDGLVTRITHDRSGSRVDYELSPTGTPIALSLSDLVATIERQLPAIMAHRASTS